MTWDRKVRRKRLGIDAFEHQFTVYKDKRRKKEKVELSNVKNVQEYQNQIDDKLQRAKDIYAPKRPWPTIKVGYSVIKSTKLSELNRLMTGQSR